MPAHWRTREGSLSPKKPAPSDKDHLINSPVRLHATLPPKSMLHRHGRRVTCPQPLQSPAPCLASKGREADFSKPFQGDAGRPGRRGPPGENGAKGSKASAPECTCYPAAATYPSARWTHRNGRQEGQRVPSPAPCPEQATSLSVPLPGDRAPTLQGRRGPT